MLHRTLSALAVVVLTAHLASGQDPGRTFTSDGELLNQDGTTVGHEALAELAVENQHGLRHWISNLMIQPSPEGAVGWAYILRIDSRGSGDSQGGAGDRNSVTEA